MTTHWASKDPDPEDILILYGGSGDCEPQWVEPVTKTVETLKDISEWGDDDGVRNVRDSG